MSRWALLLLCATTACTGTGGDPDAGSGGPTSPFLTGDFLNIAHRGGSDLAPEETLVAYENAIAVGADVLEGDLRMTSDGVIVLMHDPDVDRTTDGTGTVAGLTYAQVRALDAGYHFTTDGGATFPHRGTGVTVATLIEVLAAFPDTPLALELKDEGEAFSRKAVQLVADAGRLDDTVFASFIDDNIFLVRDEFPEAHTAFTTTEMFEFLFLDPDPNYVAPSAFIQPPHEEVDAAYVTRARAEGVVSHPWTVNDRARMEELLDLGVEGIMTDDPALLASLVAERGL